jgi:signal transduction histidine kinase
MPRQPASGWDSLERKLPVLIGGLVVVSVLAIFAVVRIELRDSAITSASERLARVAQQLEQLVNAAALQRNQVLHGVAEDPAIVSRLRAGAASAAAAGAALHRLAAAEEDRPILLLDRHGHVVAADGPPAAPPGDLPLSGTVTYSGIEREGQRSVYWVAAPVLADGGVLGHIVQQRVLGSVAVRRQLEGLIGGQIDVTLANADGTGRVRMDGSALDDELGVVTLGQPHLRTSRDGVRRYAYVTRVSASGWLLVAELPVAAATARATEVTRRLLAVGGVLLLLGCLAAWLVSRSVTAPLRRLAGAADAIAAGDYSRRTGILRNDEIGQLARSFDAMAGYVDSTHAQLAHRFDEARRLAAELETANAQLQHAVGELEYARRQAQDASAAKSEFLATMSHEIRTPINAMMGYTDLMELGVAGPLTDQQLDFVQRIHRSGQHLVSVVNDVLDFAKIESGQMRVVREEMGVGPPIEEAVATMQARATELGITLRVDCATHEFSGDVHRLQQILLNLLSNALKFTPRGGIVTISCSRRSSRAHPPAPDGEAEWTCITVCDTGIGIPTAQRELIFEPFVQGSAGYTREHGGTGLGLAISRSLARMMGGDLTVDSEPGHGASFTVWLPAARHAPATSSGKRGNSLGATR